MNDYQNTYLNDVPQAYKSQILELLDQLQSALIKNRKRQEEINRDIDEIQSRRAEKNTEGERHISKRLPFIIHQIKWFIT